jgi:hypothetical protein
MYAAWFARDSARIRAFIKDAAPGLRIVGPGDVVEANAVIPGAATAMDLITAEPRPAFDLFSKRFVQPEQVENTKKATHATDVAAAPMMSRARSLNA